MAFITFYHVSESDIEQLSSGLMQTDHHWEYVDTPLEATNLKPESEVISVSCGNAVGRDIIEQLPNLRLIAVRCSDISLVDRAAAAKRSITIVNVPEHYGLLHTTINQITDESIIKFWYGETPYAVQ